MPSCLDPACCTRSCLDLTLQSDSCQGCLKIGKVAAVVSDMQRPLLPGLKFCFGSVGILSIGSSSQSSLVAWMRKLLLWPQRMRPNNLVASPV